MMKTGFVARTLVVASAVLISADATAQEHRFTLWADAPETVMPGETFTVAFWGGVESEAFVYGDSAMAWFAFDAIGEGSIASVTTANLEPWAQAFGNSGTVVGDDVQAVSGGQITGILVFPKFFTLENPVRLFTIEVTAGASGSLTYTPANPNPNGGLSFYPVYMAGTSIAAPNDPNTSLEFIGATTRIVPAPTSLMLLGIGVIGMGTRRRLTP